MGKNLPQYKIDIPTHIYMYIFNLFVVFSYTHTCTGRTSWEIARETTQLDTGRTNVAKLCYANAVVKATANALLIPCQAIPLYHAHVSFCTGL